MPRPFDVSTESPATVAQIRSAFADEEYWRARLAVYGGDTITLDSLVVGADDAIEVVTSQDLRHDVLPGLLARAFPGDLMVIRKETWRIAEEGRVVGDVDITASGAPIAGVGSALLAPAGQGSLLRFTGTVQVRLPLIGGQIEKWIGGQVAEEIPGVQRFTSTWIAENG
ncbi:DUF2505 domain-containing protein [Mycolicibacterium palauense]|uniref:DUF2505 domain-containing protein n=1 Tax=Mycolicibacterium palauense TaxID=2034511 RepID=UPI000BFF0903|nr:DUF2505 domain-containing protein [Mycolicibacterium palauense]